MSFLVPFLVPEAKNPLNKALFDPKFSKIGTIFVSFFGTGTKFAKFFGTFLTKIGDFQTILDLLITILFQNMFILLEVICINMIDTVPTNQVLSIDHYNKSLNYIRNIPDQT